MASARVHELLTAWREAERRWERPGAPEDVHAAALAVVGAYLAYQDAVLPPETREFMLIFIPVWIVAWWLWGDAQERKASWWFPVAAARSP